MIKWISIFLLVSCVEKVSERKTYDIYNPSIQELNTFCDLHGFENYHGRFKEYSGNEVICEPITLNGVPVWRSRNPLASVLKYQDSLEK